MRLPALLCFGFLSVALIAGPSAVAQDARKVFQAGAATSNITPPLGEMIVGGWVPIPATHVHDELHARCLVLDDGSDKIAIVLCDNVGIPREVFDAAKDQIHAATEIPKQNLLLASTHTHSATTARGASKVKRDQELNDYQKFVANRISDGVRRAINNLEPAKIGWGSATEETEVFNRRWFTTDPNQLKNPFGGVDKVRMNPSRGSGSLVKPAGPIDPEVAFVSVQSVDGRPIALLANYSLHYVGGVKSGDISADYFGYFAKYIEQKLGASDQTIPFVGIMSNGTSGDINNINFRERSASRERYDKMQEVAEKVATKVYEAHGSVKFQDWVPVAGAAKELTLEVRKPTPETLAYFESLKDKIEAAPKKYRREAIYATRLQNLTEAPDSIDATMQVLRIGDLAISAIPFETFVEIGLELKDATPFEKTFTIELANGSFGYLPTPEQHELGGYETWLGTNNVEFEASRKITATLLELQKKLKQK
ncbi:neutral/alkaline non-lysosomal ceramidase N-terminal domain-containing protein [Fuerstiella marisgermanici]|uniref:Neutral/alkaline non-lysosomal ceramidase n=1 Tax=Fuerstiella marisgermanici TaxID=1891926 RepID=A0A1P8WG99_9PLAN|nr:neutral/alkaline non-lysosomal ceramidase N-terminal domain-containing protein [Fuerstiella marisgermanici]APZ93099.1 Neutral/alkaline non-lysosomal ceramidase [Fuerstiella marisgermanici]